jgi:putative ABC transport system permease protein
MMLKLALRNIFRQKVRTAMTLAAIVVSVVGLILSGGFVEDIFVQLGEAIIHSQSGHLQIATKGFFVEGSRKPEKYLIAEPEAIRHRVASLQGVDDVMVRLSFSGLLNNGRTDLSIVGEGIEPEREARLGTYLVLTAGRQLTGADRYGILLGEGVAHSLQLAAGDRATLLLSTPDGAMNALEFDVVGVFESFSKDYDARTVKIALAAAQELLYTKAASVLVVTLKKTSDTNRLADAVDLLLSDQGLETKRWQVLNDFYSKTVELYDRQLGVLRVIVLLMVLLSVINTVNMTVYERTGEIGTMRAIGNRSRFVFSLLMTESLVLGLIGVVVGVMLGILLALFISLVGIPMPPPPNANIGYTAQIRVLPGEVGSAVLVGLIATIAACILPAFRASRIRVVDALRHNA